MTEPETPALADPGARERLLAAAVALFARKGYAATTVREIVETAGVTKPVLYYYFRSKEGIFQELASQAQAAHEAILAQVLADPGTPTEKILRLFTGVFAVVLQNLDIVRIFDAVYYGPLEGSPPFDFQRLHGAFTATLRGLVAEGVRDGELRPGNVEDMTMALLGGWVLAKMAATSSRECTGMDVAGMRRVVTLVLDCLRTRGTEQGEAR